MCQNIIIPQGHLSSELEQDLIKIYGIPRQVVDIEIKKGVKPKKK